MYPHTESLQNSAQPCLQGCTALPTALCFAHAWEQSNGGTYLAHGHYTPNYNAAKEDFAVRAGLIDGNRLFDLDESGTIHGCISFAKEHCETLDYKEHKELADLLEKIEEAYPTLKDNPPFDEGESMEITM